MPARQSGTQGTDVATPAPSASPRRYPWQEDAWQALGALRERWPHALLIHGQAGIGKTMFARCLAQALLCEHADQARRPCGECSACKWFEQGNHPDFRAVFPESMTPPGFEAAEGEAAADAKSADGAKTKTLSKEIKVEQVRSLLDFCAVGAHRGGRRVVLLFPAEAMNAASSNALLKTLEEPPEGVVFLLVSSRMERLLPTIVSRCRQWPMAAPSTALATAWLTEQGVRNARAALAQAGGAPLAALEQGDDEANRRFVLTQLAAAGKCDAFACAETLQKVAVPTVLAWLQRWLYDLLSVRLAGTVRYYPDEAAALTRCAAAVDSIALARLNQELARQRASENHPLNARLQFEAIFVRYRDMFVAK